MALPEPFKKPLRAWQQGEWFRVGLDENVDGVPAPAIVQWAINEFVLGANPAVFLYLAGPIFANILYHIGNEQQQHWAELALQALDGDVVDDDREIYRGKIAPATFFAKNVLLRLSAERMILEGVDLTIMEMREESF